MILQKEKVLMVPTGSIKPIDSLVKTDTHLNCEKALVLWKGGEYDLILVTGGYLLPRKYQTKPAGIILANWFAKRGVPMSMIIVEERSLDVYEGVRFGLKRLAEEEVKNPEITLVTHWLQAVRFLVSFRLGYGLVIKLASLNYHIPLKKVLWEIALIPYQLLDRRGTGFLAKRRRQKKMAISGQT
jgi:hypothetical protein